MHRHIFDCDPIALLLAVVCVQRVNSIRTPFRVDKRARKRIEREIDPVPYTDLTRNADNVR